MILFVEAVIARLSTDSPHPPFEMHRVVLLQQHVERPQRLVPSTTQLRLLLMNVTVVSHVLLLQLAEIGPLIKDVRGCRRCNLLIDPLRRFLICEETAVTHLLQILLLL